MFFGNLMIINGLMEKVPSCSRDVFTFNKLRCSPGRIPGFCPWKGGGGRTGKPLPSELGLSLGRYFAFCSPR
jgi:hypothetical protein